VIVGAGAERTAAQTALRDKADVLLGQAKVKATKENRYVLMAKVAGMTIDELKALSKAPLSLEPSSASATSRFWRTPSERSSGCGKSK
jgi:hypothetical protein